MSGSITAHSGLFWDTSTGSTVGEDLQTAVTNAEAANATTTAALAASTAAVISANAAAAAATAATATGISSINSAASAATSSISASAASVNSTAAGVSGYATTAAGSATAAAASATSASGSATAASGSATAASGSATSASGSATTAGTAATSAGNSATAAATSAANALGSANAAVASAAGLALPAITGGNSGAMLNVTAGGAWQLQTPTQVSANLSVPAASSTSPAMDGLAAVGVGSTFARADHVHASDTSRAPLNNPTFTGTVSLGSGVNLNIGSTSGSGVLTLQAPSGTNRNLVWSSANAGGTFKRWQLMATTSENGTTGASSNWAISTPYLLNAIVNVAGSGNAYQCTTAGTSASSGPGPTGTGSGIADGTAVWNYLGLANAGGSLSLLAWDDCNSTSWGLISWSRQTRITSISYGLSVSQGLTTDTLSVTSGITFGSQLASSPTDLSKHISMYGASGYGLNVTTGTLNIVANGTAFPVNANGINAPIGFTTPSSGAFTALSGTTGNVFNTIGRNRVDNGDFEIAQRGTSGFAISGAYTLDRWLASWSAGVPTIGQATYAGWPSRKQIASTFAGLPAGGWAFYIQNIEAARSYDLAGQTVTLSFCFDYAVSAGSTSFAAKLYYANALDNFGSCTSIGSVSFYPTGTPGSYSATFAVPTAATNGLQLQVGGTQVGATGTLTMNMTMVQLELGSVATPFERLDPTTRLQRCQRFYQATPVSFVAYMTVGSAFGPWVQFPVVMRAAPTIPAPTGVSLTNGTGATAGNINPSGFFAYALATASGVSTLTALYSVSADL